MSDNPLRQYFRRPATYIKLPSQYAYYDQDTITVPVTGDLPVYPMTAIDEITAKTPDALYNGSAVVDIIKSCVPAIKDPWKIVSIDLDAILLAIRIASSGETTELECVCPKCKAGANYSINLAQILQTRTNVDYSETLKIRDLEIKFRPLTYFETNKNNMSQFEIQKMIYAIDELPDDEEKSKKSREAITRLNAIMNEVIAATIESIRTPETIVTDKVFIVEFLNNCDKKTNQLVKDFSVNLRSKHDLPPLQIKCSECSHEYQKSLELDVSDFFD